MLKRKKHSGFWLLCAKGCYLIISIVESLVTSVCLFVYLELNVNDHSLRTNIRSKLNSGEKLVHLVQYCEVENGSYRECPKIPP